MPEVKEITHLNVAVSGGRGEKRDEQGNVTPAFFFIFEDPMLHETHIVPMSEENKDHILKGWSAVDVAPAAALQGLPKMGVPKGN